MYTICFFEMLLAVVCLAQIDGVGDLKAAIAAPDGQYIVTADISCDAQNYTFQGFSGVLLGQYYKFQFNQQNAFVSGFTGLIMHLRVQHTIPAAFPGAHALKGGAGGTLKFVFVDLAVGDASSSFTNGTISTFTESTEMLMLNLTLLLQIGAGTVNAYVYGVDDAKLTAPLANISVYITINTARTAVGIAEQHVDLRNVSMQITGNRCQNVQGLFVSNFNAVIINATINIDLQHSESVCALFKQIDSGTFSFIKISVKLKSALAVQAVNRIIIEPIVFTDISVSYLFTFATESSENVEVYGIANQSTYGFNATRVSVIFDIVSAQPIMFSGIGRLVSSQNNLSQIMVQGNTTFTAQHEESKIGGLATWCHGGNYTYIYVNIALHGSQYKCDVGGLFAAQRNKAIIENAHANVTVQQFSAKGYIGGVVGYFNQAISKSTYSNVLAVLLLEQTSGSFSVIAGGFAGDAANVTCQNLVVYVDMRLEGTDTYAGGVCGVAKHFSCTSCAVTGALQFTGASAGADSGLAGAVVKLTLNNTFTSVSVNVNITSAVAMRCATFFVAAVGTELSDAISVGESLDCQREGVTVPVGVVTARTYELETAAKNMSYDGVEKTVQADFNAVALNSGFTNVFGMWRPVVTAVPHMFNYTHFAANHTAFSNGFVLLCVPGSTQCLGTVSGLHNTIPDAIGNISNPYGFCQSGSCTSDCSGHGIFGDGACECEIGYIGEICAEKLCDFKHGVRQQTNAHQYCQCEPQYYYVNDISTTAYAETCQTPCTTPLCKANYKCYTNASTYQCILCGPGITGSKCDACVDITKIFDGDFVCKTKYGSGNGVCWFVSEDCITDNCAYACSSCDSGYMNDHADADRCKPKCISCTFGECYFPNSACTTYPECEYACVSCTGDYIPDSQWRCQKKCAVCNGTCWFRNKICYDPATCAYQCSSCDSGYVLSSALICLQKCAACNGDCWFENPACTDPTTCQYTCNSCDSGYTMVGSHCEQNCTQCLFGNCYFPDPCDSGNPATCQVKCTSCSSEYHVMDQCQSCVAGYQYVNQKCVVVVFGLGGKYYKDELDQIVMLQCLPGYLLENGNTCRLKCTEGGCVHGIECYYDNYLPSALYSCSSCQPNYSGVKCDTCASGAILFENACREHCQDCNGNCIITESKPICFSCNTGYSGGSCDTCEAGYVKDGSKCHKGCANCNGECYTLGSITKCISCWPHHEGADCKTCTSPYTLYNDVCSEQLSIPHGIDCYRNHLFEKCDSCQDGYGGELCDSCISGFFYHDGECHKIENGNYCTDTKCIKCNATNVLINGECIPHCSGDGCAGECGIKNGAVLCSSCLPGHVMKADACYVRVPNDNGICYKKGGQTVCDCFVANSGPLCTQCSTVRVDGICYKKLVTSHGECYVHPLDATKVFCVSCSPEYNMPDCRVCASGYKTDSNGDCTVCDSGYVNMSGLCVSVDGCASCFQGACKYHGSDFVCTEPCSIGYSGLTCTECAQGYIKYGSYCLDADNTEPSLSQLVNTVCKPAEMSFNCTQCAPEHNFDGTCQTRSPAMAARCYDIGDRTMCGPDFECPVFNRYTMQCITCMEYDTQIGSWCYRPITNQRSSSLYHGTCYSSVFYDSIVCTECETGWALPTCVGCAPDFLPCIVNQQSACCPETESQIGRCYEGDNDAVVCVYCGSGYTLNAKGVCVSDKVFELLTIFWICFLCLFVLCAVILTAVYFTRSSYVKLKIKRKLRIVLSKISTKVLFTLMAQAVALIIAMQDVYIGSFNMQIAVNLASSAPFFLLFGFISFPKFRGFQVGHWGDVPLFLSGALLEAAFLLIHYYLIPETFGFSETFYKLSAPPVALVMFVLAARMKYTRMQIGGFFIALAFPILLYVVQTISESLGMYYFSADSYGSVLVGFLCVVAIELVLSCQYYITDMVLGKYDEFASVLRLASAQFLVAVAFFACAPQPCLDAMSDLGPFLFCFLTQIVVNVLSVVIMSNLTVMEYQINIITSAVWVQLIESVGEVSSATNNNINVSASRLVLSCFQMGFVIAGLTVFVAFANSFFDLHNENRDGCQKEEMYDVAAVGKYLSRMRSITSLTGIQEHYVLKLVPESAKFATILDAALLEMQQGRQLSQKMYTLSDSQLDDAIDSSRIFARSSPVLK